MLTNTKQRTHILLYPFPTAGHIIPLLDLTNYLLSSRSHHQVTITIAITPSNLHLLDHLHSSALHHVLLPSPAPTPTATSQVRARAPNNRMATLLRTIQHLHQRALLSWFQSHPSPPVVIISDFFLGWTHHLACQVGVPRIVFSPSGAFAFSISLASWHDLPGRNENGDINMDVDVVYDMVPLSPRYPWWQLVDLYRDGKKGDPDWEIFRENYLSNMASKGVLFNTFADVEGVYLDHVKQKYFGQDYVWALGPMLPDDARLGERGGCSTVPCHQVLAWLDSCKEGSVAYVCFGSRAALTQRQMDVLALALEKSGVYFVWCVRQPTTNRTNADCGVLPDGFEKRMAGRGFIIKGWAPQVTILRHCAIGSFLTHCGWNSTIEGISVGTIMLTWPMGADQYTNAELLVDQLGIGIRVSEGVERIPDSSELVRILIKSLEKTRPERNKAQKLKKAAVDAINGGSSYQDLEKFVNWVCELEKPKTCGIVSHSDDTNLSTSF